MNARIRLLETLLDSAVNCHLENLRQFIVENNRKYAGLYGQKIIQMLAHLILITGLLVEVMRSW